MPCRLASSTVSQTPVRALSLYTNELTDAEASIEVFQHAPAEDAGKRKLFIVISSDKGLCGGIHSSVTKATRRIIAAGENGVQADSPIMVIGDKSKAQLSRSLGKNLVMSFNQIGRDIPTFSDAAGVADLIIKSGVEYDSISIVYNKFVSAISYESAVMEVETEEGLKNSRRLPSCATFETAR